jgi:bacillithiol system protein YtxJ
LDLIANREISNEIATLLKVEHQSPQAILVRNDEVIYVESHNGISASSIQALI